MLDGNSNHRGSGEEGGLSNPVSLHECSQWFIYFNCCWEFAQQYPQGWVTGRWHDSNPFGLVIIPLTTPHKGNCAIYFHPGVAYFQPAIITPTSGCQPKNLEHRPPQRKHTHQKKRKTHSPRIVLVDEPASNSEEISDLEPRLLASEVRFCPGCRGKEQTGG